MAEKISVISLDNLKSYNSLLQNWVKEKAGKANEADLSEVAFSGSYENLQDKPFYVDEVLATTFTKAIKPGYTVTALSNVLNGDTEGLTSASINFVPGKKYNITLDDVVYSNLEAYNIFPGYATGVGNTAMVPFGALADKNLDLPFVLINLMNYWYLVCETAGSHEFSIESVVETEVQSSKFVFSDASSGEIDPLETYELFYNGVSQGTSPVMQTNVLGYDVYILGNPDLLMDIFSVQGIPTSTVENLSDIEDYAIGYISGADFFYIVISEISEEDFLSFTFAVPGFFDESEFTADMFFDGNPSSEIDEDSGSEILSEEAPWIYMLNYENPFNPDFPRFSSYNNKRAVLSLGNYSVEDNIELLYENSSEQAYGVNINYDSLDPSATPIPKQGYMCTEDMKILGESEYAQMARFSILIILPELFSSELQTFSITIYDDDIHKIDKKFIDISWNDITEKPEITDEEFESIFEKQPLYFTISDEGVLGRNSYYYFPAKLIIPEKVKGIEVKELDSYFASGALIVIVECEAQLRKINDSAFNNCKYLQDLILPESVSEIGSSVFYGCTSLTEITYLGTVAQWEAINKNINWAASSSIVTIHCSDDDVDL